MRMIALLSTALALAASPVLAQEATTAPARTDMEARIASLEKQLESTAYSADRFAFGREIADLRRIAALLLGRWAKPNSLLAPCAACNCTISLGQANRSALYQLDILNKKIDDVLWHERVGDVADIDKVYYTGPPNPRAEETYGIANERHPFKVWAYVFVPRDLDRSRQAPLLLFLHGGVHGDFDTYYTHIIRELMARGYVVVAPEYRGSTGYGREYQEAIDYGGLEVGDVVAGRDWAVETLPFVDPARVGIIGWSHGGLIALLSVFDHPDKFQVAFAGVPVSDLVARMGYLTDDYRALFSAPYHIGKPAYRDVDAYRRRSPAWNAAKLQRPLLIHATTNDRDVNIIEVEHLIAQLRAAGKDFQYRIYQDAPGGHSFDRIDTPLAHTARQEIYAFLARHLERRESPRKLQGRAGERGP